MSPHGPLHVFSNMLDFAANHLRPRLDMETRYDFDELRDLILKPAGQIVFKAACAVCVGLRVRFSRRACM